MSLTQIIPISSNQCLSPSSPLRALPLRQFGTRYHQYILAIAASRKKIPCCFQCGIVLEIRLLNGRMVGTLLHSRRTRGIDIELGMPLTACFIQCKYFKEPPLWPSVYLLWIKNSTSRDWQRTINTLWQYMKRYCWNIQITPLLAFLS